MSAERKEKKPIDPFDFELTQKIRLIMQQVKEQAKIQEMKDMGPRSFKIEK